MISNFRALLVLRALCPHGPFEPLLVFRTSHAHSRIDHLESSPHSQPFRSSPQRPSEDSGTWPQPPSPLLNHPSSLDSATPAWPASLTLSYTTWWHAPLGLNPCLFLLHLVTPLYGRTTMLHGSRPGHRRMTSFNHAQTMNVRAPNMSRYTTRRFASAMTTSTCGSCSTPDENWITSNYYIFTTYIL
jgi:hypothetical protein